MKKPLISILMLSYNHSDFIGEAIDSVISNKSKDYNLELIIIDDGSTDATESIVLSYNDLDVPIQFIQKKHQGVTFISKNFNELIQLANGDYITFLASDDSYSQGRFSRQLTWLESSSDNVFSLANGVNCKYGQELGSVVSEQARELLNSSSPKRIYDYLINNVPTIFIQSALVKSSFIKSFQSFDPDLIADDWVFNIRVFERIISKEKNFKFIDEVVFIRNIHDSNTSRDHWTHYLRVSQVAEKYCSPRSEKYIKSTSQFLMLVSYIKAKNFSGFLSFFYEHVSLIDVLICVPKFLWRRWIK